MKCNVFHVNLISVKNVNQNEPTHLFHGLELGLSFIKADLQQNRICSICPTPLSLLASTVKKILSKIACPIFDKSLILFDLTNKINSVFFFF